MHHLIDVKANTVTTHPYAHHHELVSQDDWHIHFACVQVGMVIVMFEYQRQARKDDAKKRAEHMERQRIMVGVGGWRGVASQWLAVHVRCVVL